MPMRKNKSQAHQLNPYIYNIHLPTYRLPDIYKPQNTSSTHSLKQKNKTNPDIPKQKSPFQASTSFIHPLKKTPAQPKPKSRNSSTKKKQKSNHSPIRAHLARNPPPANPAPTRPGRFPCLLLSSSFYGARVLIIVVKCCRLIGGDKKA